VGGRHTRRAVHTRCGRGAPSTGTGHGLKRWSTCEPACGLSTRLAGGQACCPRRASRPQPQPRGLCDGIHRWCCWQHRALVCPWGLPAFLPVHLWFFARASRPLDPKPLRFPAFPRQLLPGRPRGQFLQGCALLNSPPILVFAAVVKASRPCPAGGLRPALTLRQRRSENVWDRLCCGYGHQPP